MYCRGHVLQGEFAGRIDVLWDSSLTARNVKVAVDLKLFTVLTMLLFQEEM